MLVQFVTIKQYIGLRNINFERNVLVFKWQLDWEGVKRQGRMVEGGLIYVLPIEQPPRPQLLVPCSSPFGL